VGAKDQVRVTPERRVSAAAHAQEEIRLALVTGEIAGGMPVREEYWAQRLSLSRTPVREAINSLVVAGLLVRNGRTAHVFQPSLDDLLEISDMRMALEPLAAKRAGARADAGLADELSGILDKLHAAEGPRGNGREWFAQHEAFHLGLYDGEHSPRLISTISILRAQTEPYIRFAAVGHPDYRSTASSQHHEMVGLLRAGDAQGLADVVRKHLAASRRHVHALIEDGWFPMIAPPISSAGSRHSG
jgi:DNA-binding GntR family transcriptional regulator